MNALLVQKEKQAKKVRRVREVYVVWMEYPVLMVDLDNQALWELPENQVWMENLV